MPQARDDLKGKCDNAEHKPSEALPRAAVGEWPCEPPSSPYRNRAVTFAPSGKVVVDALSSLRKGGVVAINAIHLSQIPAFNYDSLLWGERQIRSVLKHPKDTLLAVKDDREPGSVVLVP